MTFTAIDYTLDDAGKDFTYYIKEIIPEATDNGTRHGGRHHLRHGEETETVSEVIDNGDGTLTVKYDGKDSFTTPEFSNEYAAEGSAVLSAKKATNANLGNRTFEFELLDANGRIEKSQAVKAGQSVTFTAIDYTLDDAGKDFTYTIKEIPEGADGQRRRSGTGRRTYDAHTETVVVTVMDNGDGTLTVKYRQGTSSRRRSSRTTTQRKAKRY